MVVQRSRISLSWDKSGMNLPKEIIPKCSSPMFVSFVRAEGFLEHILELEADARHEICWRTWQVSREWLVLLKLNWHKRGIPVIPFFRLWETLLSMSLSILNIIGPLMECSV